MRLLLELSPERVRELVNKPQKMPDVLPPGRYVVEPKYDGERVLILVAGGEAVMANRYATTYTREMLPRLLAEVSEHLPEGLFDAELVVPGGNLYDVTSAAKKGLDDKLCLMVFDVLKLGAHDVRELPLLERKAMLRERVQESGRVKLVPWHRAANQAEVKRFFDDYVQAGFEGVVVKTDGPYWAPWYKLKKLETIDLVVLGIRKTKDWLANGVAQSFLVGRYDPRKKEFVPVCYVSSGLSPAEKEAIGRFFLEKGLVVGEDREVVYVQPLLVLEVGFQEWSGNGKMRHPRILRIRWDKAPQECV